MKIWEKLKRKKFLFISILVILVPIVIVLIINLTKRITGITPEQIQRYTNNNIFLEALIVMVIYTIKSVLFFIPIAFLYILTGAIFPPAYAILFNLCGMTVCLTLTFLLGRLLGQKKVLKIAAKSEKVKKFMENPEKNNITLFILRISGIFPVELISLVCGCSKYKYVNFLLYSLIAMIPSMIPFSIMGKAIINPFSKEFLIPMAIALLLMIGSLVFYKIKNKDD